MNSIIRKEKNNHILCTMNALHCKNRNLQNNDEEIIMDYRM